MGEGLGSEGGGGREGRVQLSGRGPVSPLADQMFCAEEPTQHNVSNILAFFLSCQTL